MTPFMTTKRMFPMGRAWARLELFNLGVTSYDFNNQSKVAIVHHDGTLIRFNYAFYMKEGEWYYVFTEHHGSSLYHEEDLDFIKEYYT